MTARFAPGATSIRPFLHKLRGVNIQGQVFIGDDVYLENEYPECVELHDGAQICLRSIILAHSHGLGRIVIGKDAFIAANCVVAASPGTTLTIGEGAVVTASSVVTSDVPPHTLFGNEKAKPLAMATIPLRTQSRYDQFLAGLRPLKRNSPPNRITSTSPDDSSKPDVEEDQPKSANGSSRQA
jgi:serine acetyltransferase